MTARFRFTGFFQPVNNLPAMNVVKAGKAVILKFSLSGYKGLEILAPGYPVSTEVPCAAGGLGSAPMETGGDIALTYNALSDQYSYGMKTEKAWKGSCRILLVRLIDGTEQAAMFQFR